MNRGIPVVLQDGSHTYIYGLGLIAQVDGSDEPSYLLANGLGSTEALLDAQGNPVAGYRYDAFGAVRSLSGPRSTEFRFAGEQEDATLGYTYLRARYLDPAVGRFISRDPFPGVTTDPASQHRFAYAHNSPTTLTDPSGRFAIAIPLVAYGYVAVGAAVIALQVWWMLPDNQVRNHITQCTANLADSQDLSTWFAKGREKGEVKWYKRGMTRDQAERFQREVEEEKRTESRGPRDNLPPERMEEIRNDILEGRR